MPTTEDLARLQGMLAALTPLTTKGSGEVIRAEDWNTLAGAVTAMAGVVISAGPDVAPPHDHAGAVGLSWLDPGLRAVVQGGGLSDPSSDARLGAVERGLSRLDERITAMGDLVTQLQTAAGNAAADNLNHRGRIAAIDATVSGLSDARTDVANLRSSLASLQVSVSTAVKAADGLQVDGQPIGDVVTALVDRVGRTEGVERQNSATLAQVSSATTDVVTHAQLQEAVGSVQATLSPEERDALRQSVESDVQQSINATVGGATQQLQNQLTDGLAGIDGKVSTAVASATSGVTAAVVAQVQPQINDAVAASQASILTTVSTQIGDAVSRSQDTVEADLATLRTQVPGIVGQEVTRQVGGALSGVDTQLGTLGQRLDAVNQRVAAHDSEITALNRRVTQIPLDEAGNRQALQTQLEGEIGQQGQTSDAALAAGLAGVRTDFQSQLAGSIAQLSSSVNDQLNTVRAGVATQLQQTSDSLRTQMVTIADQRIEVARPVILGQAGGGRIGEVPIGRIENP